MKRVVRLLMVILSVGKVQRKYASSFSLSISEEMDSENELEDDNVLSVSHKYSSMDESHSKENEESDLEERSEMSSQHDDDVLAPKPKRPRRSSMATQEDGTELDPDKVVPENDFNAKKEKSTGKKGGPKSLWTTEMLDDLVDIIVRDNVHSHLCHAKRPMAVSFSTPPPPPPLLKTAIPKWENFPTF